MAVDKLQVKAQQPVAPKAATPNGAKSEEAKAASVGVDVANFRILPLAGAPQVSAKADPTLGKTGLVPFLLDKIEGLGKAGQVISNGFRFFTRVVGPAALWASTVRNTQLLFKADKDPAISGKSKVALWAGTIGTGLAAATATIAALPAKLAGMIGLNTKRQIGANKASNIAGGVAGMVYSTINMIETLKNKDAKPAERFFSKTGFGLGALGFVFGTTALLISSGFGPAAALGSAAPWLLPLASKVATVAGIGGMASWIAQMVFGKNNWLNQKLKGTALG